MSHTDKLKSKLAEISFNKGGDQVIYLGDAIRTSSSILEEYRKEFMSCIPEEIEYPEKKSIKTGEYDFGKSPSSICRSCGQERHSRLQGNNKFRQELLSKISQKGL